MKTITIILSLALLYFFTVFILIRLIAPYMGFKKPKASRNLSKHWQNVARTIKKEARNKEEALKLAYQALTKRHQGGRATTLTRFWRAFGDPFTKPEGKLQCNQQVYILHSLLVQSGFFSEKEIKYKFGSVNLFIHQTLKVKIGDRWINVDPWSNFLGLKIGDKSPLFK